MTIDKYDNYPYIIVVFDNEFILWNNRDIDYFKEAIATGKPYLFNVEYGKRYYSDKYFDWAIDNIDSLIDKINK